MIIAYFILTLINIVLVLKNKTYLIAYIFSALGLFISYLYYSSNLGELWCFFVIFIPIIMLIIQKLNIIN